VTTFSRTTVNCDFHNCTARSESTVLGAAKARQQATEDGWKRWADSDFCPDPVPNGYYPIESYRPRNHARWLTGEHQPTLVRMPPAYTWSKSPQWRVTCACSWDGDAETPKYDRKSAASSWAKHVENETGRDIDE
jgi:hypothetical protein